MAEILAFNSQKSKPPVMKMRKAPVVEMAKFTEKNEIIQQNREALISVLDYIWSNADNLTEEEWADIDERFGL